MSVASTGSTIANSIAMLPLSWSIPGRPSNPIRRSIIASLGQSDVCHGRSTNTDCLACGLVSRHCRVPGEGDGQCDDKEAGGTCIPGEGDTCIGCIHRPGKSRARICSEGAVAGKSASALAGVGGGVVLVK